jgi:methylthioribulose-1-phosphate dehydratase
LSDWSASVPLAADLPSEGSAVTESFPKKAVLLAEISRTFYGRAWALGTSGNFSAVISRDPLRLAISPSGVDKGSLEPAQILLIDEQAKIVSEHQAKPSDESLLHIRIVLEREAGAVLHTHSVWSTTLSNLYAADGGVAISDYEMLKGLAGVQTHEHREWLPLIDNSQDMPALAQTVSQVLRENQESHGFILRRHGLYTWVKDVD